MELIKKITSKVSKKEFIFVCIFSTLCVFNYFIFGQFDVILNNPSEFGITAAEVIWIFVWRSLLILVVVISALVTLRCLTRKGFTYTVAVLFGLVLAGYVQVLFMNKTELMAVNGTMAHATAGQFISNMIFYICIVLIPVAIVFYENKKKKGFTPKLAFAISLVLFGMQLVGVMSAVAGAPKTVKDNELYYFSVDEQLKLSNNKNIIVFILDNFDTSVADKIFKNSPETEDIFSGFIYYQDNISEYPGTFPSVASLVTNVHYEEKMGNRIIDYLKEAWNGETLFDILQDNDYKVNVLMDAIVSFYDFKDLEDRVDNVRQVERKNRKVKGASFFSAIMDLALMRQSPYSLKYLFFNKKYLDIANYCIEVKDTPDYFARTISANSDLRFYDKLKTVGLSSDEDKNVFSFIQLIASHSPFLYDKDLNPRKNSSAVSQTQGTFKILDEYFTQMKDLGIYDDATIIVTADHGSWKNKLELVSAPTTALFVKESRSTDDGPTDDGLKYDEDKHGFRPELSHRNFFSTILAEIGYTDGDFPPSYFDIIKNGGTQTRYFYYVKWNNLISCSFLATYEIKGNSKEVGNWTKVS